MVSLEAVGRRAVVTAGANGIGLAIVEALVAADARVHICDVEPAALDDCARRLGVTTTRCGGIA